MEKLDCIGLHRYLVKKKWCRNSFDTHGYLQLNLVYLIQILANLIGHDDMFRSGKSD